MKYAEKIEALSSYCTNADHIDIKEFQGDVTLREFIAGMLSYYPWWLVQLYRIRSLLVSVLGLVKHDEPEELPKLTPEAVSFCPGESVSFFIVRDGREEEYWLAETPDDKHLSAYLCVVREPAGHGHSRFYVATAVFYKHWTGPVYFNLIRPFHHLVVGRMGAYGAKR